MKICSFSRTAVLCAMLSGAWPAGVRAAPGDVDAIFDPNADSTVDSALPQPDGKIIVVGDFSSLQPNGAANATTRNKIARLNADGTLDPDFVPSPDNTVLNTAVQLDGKIILVGRFTSLQTTGATYTARRYVARLNADGTIDTTFDPSPNARVLSVALQPDGKIILAGYFGLIQPNGATTISTRNYIARVNADGTLDTTFNPNPNAAVQSVAVQADGKIILAGNFTTLQPNGAGANTARNYVARVNADGTLDTTFNPNAGAVVNAAAVQADGKIVLVGGFIGLQPNGAATSTPRKYIARVNADGTLDSTFDPAANNIAYGAVVQTDGKIIVGGNFTSLQPNGAASATTRNRIARVNADGTLDTTFNPNAINTVYNTALQTDGKIVVAGLFNSLQPNGAASATARHAIARLDNDAATQKILVTGATTSLATVQWLRGGALPETPQTTFEFSFDGGSSWTAPVAGTRITGGWQYQLNLSSHPSGLVRARARVSGGYTNGSSGLLEQVQAYPPYNFTVAQPVNTVLTDGVSTVDFGERPTGVAGNGAALTFTVRNMATVYLSLSAFTLDGANAADFSVNGGANIPPGGTATFVVTFAPTGSASAARTAALHIANDGNNGNGQGNPFDIALTGLGLSTTADTDGDGLNDHAEYQFSSLGFNWQVSQPALVQALYSGASTAGLYTASQVQALNVGTPLLQKDASTGQFKLTIAVQQSADLKTYAPLPLSTGSTTINSAGALQYQFSSSTGAQFYRLQSQ